MDVKEIKEALIETLDIEYNKKNMNDLELSSHPNTPAEALSELAKDEVFNENKNKNI